MNLLALVVVSKLIITSSVSWADVNKARNATAPYYCNGLTLKDAEQSADKQLRSYHFAGICSVRESDASGWAYKRTWLEIKGRWDKRNHTATEVSEVTAGGSGELRISMKCDDDPWVTNAKCVLGNVENKTQIQNFQERFKVRKVTNDVTVLAGYPPIARFVTNATQVDTLLKQKQSHLANKKSNLSSITHAQKAPAGSTSTHKSAQESSLKTPVTDQKPKARKYRVVKQPVPVLKHTVEKSRHAASHPKVLPQHMNYLHPSYKGHRLGWCYRWGSQCGKIAADAWCKFKQFDQAKEYKIAYNLGKTLILGDNRLCLHHSCAGFENIVCESKQKNIVNNKQH